MKRGEVYEARLDPAEGSEQAGHRPVILVSRDAINRASPVVVVVPCTTRRSGRRLYPSHVELETGDGGVRVPSVALCEQVRAIAKSRLGPCWGEVTRETRCRIDRALLVTLDLQGE